MVALKHWVLFSFILCLKMVFKINSSNLLNLATSHFFFGINVGKIPNLFFAFRIQNTVNSFSQWVKPRSARYYSSALTTKLETLSDIWTLFFELNNKLGQAHLMNKTSLHWCSSFHYLPFMYTYSNSSKVYNIGESLFTDICVWNLWVMRVKLG